LDFYTNRYVKQLFNFTTPNEDTIIADVGTGFGWLAIAFAYCTDSKIIAIDENEERLKAGRQIANILGVEHKIDWRVGSLGKLPLDQKEAHIVYCIEVLEHVYRAAGAIQDLCRVSSEFMIITTPNLWFPIIAHDTQLPICHWLPIPIRKVYAKLFKRQDRENDNLFWSPYSLKKNMPGFKPVSKWLHYASYKNHKDTYPFYLPYGNGKYVSGMGKNKKLYYDLVSKFGMLSHWILPSLAYVFKRENC